MLALLLPLRRGVAVDVKRTLGSGQAAVRGTVLLSLAIFIAYGVFYFVRAALRFLIANGGSAYIPPSTTLGLILSVILGMVLISCFVSSVGSLFFAADLPLLLAAPIPRHQFFFAKLFELTLTASWLVIIFGIPALWGYWVVFGKPVGFWSTVLIAMPPYFLAPAAISMFLSTTLATMVPLNRTREFMIALSVIGIIGIVVLLKITIPTPSELRNITVLLSLMAGVLHPPTLLNPASWTGAVLGEALQPSGSDLSAQFLWLSYAWCGFWIAVSFIFTGLFHSSAFSKAASMRLKGKRNAGIIEKLALLFPAKGSINQLARKELLLFLRDPGQAMQLLILLGLCVIYLYNLKMLHAIQGLEDGLKVWWQVFLTISNATLASFVLSAMCTRLVFPSVSLEGTCWWIGQVAPVTVKEILLAKSKAWTVPVSIVSAVIFAAGSLAIGAETPIIATTIVAGLILSWGMVRLAVGLGAQYARFDWEHPSQLAASFGSLVFMLFSIGFIATAMCAPATVAVLSLQGAEFSNSTWIVLTLFSLGTELLATYWIANLALSAGIKALEERR